MGDTFITDIVHFEGIPAGPSHEPARRMAQFFGDIVSAASVSPAGELIEAALFCRRRPGRMKCPGHLQIRRDGGFRRYMLYSYKKLFVCELFAFYSLCG